ncbi:tyrosine-type recombinase/integrase [Longimycelium tulufanense]|uniref:tyrosine-type recombinase/integrase n=1 Tax=Longimycelium tulufanense TaxID=907463 RepID=UPI001E4F2B22|nr:site-specific integrase [Longimycelium tulufanense]
MSPKPSGGYVARTKYRDYDGVTRLVERSGKSETAARNNLLEALRDRSASQGNAAITPETKFRVAASIWLAEMREAADAGDLSPNSIELYERQLRNYAYPALGELRLCEVTTPRVDAVLREIRKRRGASTAKTVRSVISGVMRLAARHGAVKINPTREVGRIKGDPKRPPRALTPGERRQWIEQLEADERAVRKDLPDLTRWMLATGVRIGEALAVSWDEIDLDSATVDIEWKLIRVKGKGLQRVPRLKSDSGERTLPLPPFAVAMLRRRRQTRGDAYPIFPDAHGGWRDPSNTRRDLRHARGTDGFAWVTSHVFRKTCATILDEAKFTPREIADQLGHARPSLTQDVYLGRKIVNRAVADALEALGDT